MSGRECFRRIVILFTLLPLATLLGCASSASNTDRAPRVERAAISNDLGGKSIELLFEGRFPGVTVERMTNGRVHIRIRGGANSFIASNEPLYVVDGTPFPSGTGGLFMLNPYDIEKIEVLKNPADIAIYGIRGGNGVIRITTKRPGRR